MVLNAMIARKIIILKVKIIRDGGYVRLELEILLDVEKVNKSIERAECLNKEVAENGWSYDLVLEAINLHAVGIKIFESVLGTTSWEKADESILASRSCLNKLLRAKMLYENQMDIVCDDPWKDGDK